MTEGENIPPSESVFNFKADNVDLPPEIGGETNPENIKKEYKRWLIRESSLTPDKNKANEILEKTGQVDNMDPEEARRELEKAKNESKNS